MNTNECISLHNQPVLVAGAGKSGISAAKLLKKIGADVFLYDENPDILNNKIQNVLSELNISILPAAQIENKFAEFGKIIISPGYPVTKLKKKLEKCCLENMPSIIGELEFAWRLLNEETVIAITGTSGKTTTSSLIASILREAGKKVFLGGNIGIPLSDYVLKNDIADIIVLEVSSFQLQTCSRFAPDIALFLNITPNHLDYHTDMQEYLEAKCKIFENQGKNDLAIIGQQAQKYIEAKMPNTNIVWFDNHSRFPESQLFGKHNQYNLEAAWQVCKHLGVSLEIARKAIKNFKPLDNRLEEIGEIDGTLFINDSKATTVSSLEVALSAFSRPILLLCGGKFKGGDLSLVCPLLRDKVKKIALFGGSREDFEDAWAGTVPMEWHPTLEAAMRALDLTRKPEDVVLLSPATASFDQYTNYEERGEDFKRIFHSIKQQYC